MVRKAIGIVYREVRGLHQAAYVVALFTVGSQLLALVRDRLLAHQFGAGIELDLYYAAFRVPDLLYVLFASTLSVYVLIPFVSERLGRGSDERAQRFLSQIFSLFLVIYAVLALIIALCAPQIVTLLFPGFAEHTDTLVLLMRVLLLQPLFLGISSIFGVITQLGHRFVLYALSPLLYNIGIIFGITVLYPYFGLVGIAAGVVLGAVGHVGIQLPFVQKSSVMPRGTLSFVWSDMRRVCTTSVPRALTLSLHQIVLLVLVGVASVMTAGSVSVFQFGFNLQSVPLAVIGVSYSVAAFPTLAKLFAEGKREVFTTYLVTALRHVMFWSLPIVAVLVVVRAQFVRVVLGSGAFDWNDTRLTAAVFALFIISLLAQGFNLLLVRAFYASGNTRVPFFVTLASSAGILACSLFLYEWFQGSVAFRTALESTMRVSGVPGTEILVLALGYTLVLLVHGIVLTVIASRLLPFSLKALVTHFVRALFAAFVAGFVAYSALNFFTASGLRSETFLATLTHGVVAALAGLAGAVLTYYALGSEELREVWRALRKRLFKTEVIAPQDEDHLAV